MYSNKVNIKIIKTITYVYGFILPSYIPSKFILTIKKRYLMEALFLGQNNKNNYLV